MVYLCCELYLGTLALCVTEQTLAPDYRADRENMERRGKEIVKLAATQGGYIVLERDTDAA